MAEHAHSDDGLTSSDRHVVVAIASPLEPELVAEVRAVDERIDVLYDRDLLPPIRYPSDHEGLETFQRTPEQEKRWLAMLARTEVLFGLPGDTPDGLAKAVRTAPGLKWVQGTAAGSGEQVRDARLNSDELARVAITSASGVHAGMLGEFAMLGLLAFTKDLPRLLTDKAAQRWDHRAVRELRGQTLLIVGFGSIGEEVGRLARAFGMRVIGVNRSGSSASPHVDEIHATARLLDLLPRADAVVVALPSTGETDTLINSTAFQLMRPGAVFVNVGRGRVVDEAALTAALTDGRLSGAALDVFATEPLPQDSPLWAMPNVLLSPHTAALSVLENARIVELFCENLRRYLASTDLINRIDPALLY
jgi:phosphoglycerate dehydrogenase-like enzyme